MFARVTSERSGKLHSDVGGTPNNLFEFKYNCTRDDMPEIVEGKVPCRELKARFSPCRFDNSPIDIGMLEVRLFWSKNANTRAVKFPRQAGNGPLNLLADKDSVRREDRSQSAVGRLEEKRLLEATKLLKLFKAPIEVGSDEVKAQEYNCNWVNAVSCPI